jgi:hypothetical protein
MMPIARNLDIATSSDARIPRRIGQHVDADAIQYATEKLPFGEPLNARSAWAVSARAAICPFVRGHAPAPISWLIKVSCDGIYLCVSTVKSLTPNAKVSKQTKAATLASRECS